ncbi:metal-dependent hydrolase [Natrarchaeobaculum sulfurireducens]|uniref:Membrane-bound metal-dependent hydrolase YbcI n=1 Tax=Natrarchaeobaculum sulfurireducens TaxID=2044521 RepID=A0A346PK68_9EURY|nr:metal-dependent hydrolase [Natrarchaeobaculum sulfurireducens]AXR79913.1 Membrane-bound metal-dependent hydrolase YbcI [Natrarchaeobaculum sulfurireducens]
MRLPGVPHRGPTHTVWFVGAVGVATGFAGALIGWNAGLLEAILLGSFTFLIGAGTVISHIAADALTPAGVRPFAPRNETKYTYSVARVANPLANYALLAIGFVAAAGAVGLATRLTAAIGF